MKKSVKMYLIIITIVLTACNEEKKNQDQDQVVSVQKCLLDTLTHHIAIYYPNDVLRERGFIRYMKKQGFWTEFYNDGEVRRILYYENDSIIRPKCPDISACIFFEDNSLKIGKKTRVRVRYLHPHDIFTASENIKIEKLEDASEYDYCITPLSGKAADFYYLKKEKEEIPDKEIGIMAKKLHVSRKEIEQLHMERIITKQVFLKSMKIM